MISSMLVLWYSHAWWFIYWLQLLEVSWIVQPSLNAESSMPPKLPYSAQTAHLQSQWLTDLSTCKRRKAY